MFVSKVNENYSLFPCDDQRTKHLLHCIYWNITNMAAIIFLVIFIAQAIAEKRILLNDPDLLQSQIHALERKVEDVVAKNNDLFTKYNDQSNKYNDLATKYTDLSAKYNTLLTKTNGLYM